MIWVYPEKEEEAPEEVEEIIDEEEEEVEVEEYLKRSCINL